MSTSNLDLALLRLTDVVREIVREVARDELQAMWDQRWRSANQIEGAVRVSELHEVLHTSRSTAYQLVKDGELASVEIGGRLHVRTAEIARWLKANEKRSRHLKASAGA